MDERIKLQSIGIRNFLAAGSDVLRLDLGGENAVLCGPNGTGKTSLLYAADLLKRTLSISSVKTIHHEFVDVVLWRDARPFITADLFHRAALSADLDLAFTAPASNDDVADLALIAGSKTVENECLIEFGVTLKKDHTYSLVAIRLDDIHLFKAGSATKVFTLDEKQPTDAVRYDIPVGKQLRSVGERAARTFELPSFLLSRTLYLPSRRVPTLGAGGGTLATMTSGEGLITWIKTATNPDPNERESQRRHLLLSEFQEEFAEFAGFRRISLSVPDIDLLHSQGVVPEIGATLDSGLRPISRLGAGIAESLIILLLCKLSQELEPRFDILLLEEPELHLHPTLQRRLLQRIIHYGVQLVVSTHSSTVVNALAKSGARVFRMSAGKSAAAPQAFRVQNVAGTRLLLESIGSSPADLALADRVLMVEGPNDVPVMKEWISKSPDLHNQTIAVLPFGGSDAASENFDASQLNSLHSKISVLLDSERKSSGAPAEESKRRIEDKLRATGINCRLTERRATESYFTIGALRAVYPQCPDSIGPFGDPNLAAQGVQQFKKSRNIDVARAMEWTDLESTDIGAFITEFLRA